MSLLASQSATHTVEVVLRTRTLDSRQRPVYVETDRVTVHGRMTPAGAGDATRLGGVSVAETVKLITGPGMYPGDAFSQVIYDGVVYDTIGTPARQRSSRMTSYDSVLLSAKSQKAGSF